jgi:hypothetical protein
MLGHLHLVLCEECGVVGAEQMRISEVHVPLDGSFGQVGLVVEEAGGVHDGVQRAAQVDGVGQWHRGPTRVRDRAWVRTTGRARDGEHDVLVGMVPERRMAIEQLLRLERQLFQRRRLSGCTHHAEPLPVVIVSVAGIDLVVRARAPAAGANLASSIWDPCAPLGPSLEEARLARSDLPAIVSSRRQRPRVSSWGMSGPSHSRPTAPPPSAPRTGWRREHRGYLSW